eukprot:TRINITY_DN60321_c0_g1_i1.p1 TRINITY_DN60321_c0_g1~~TRINITY_DN60321_c0_g1_i1.p1  ORF type:complete len:256 (-),score=57.47 TRINITY_DN60321_c0_g1_i1:56-823(-)
MVSTEGEVIREASPADKKEALTLITEILAQEQSLEFGRQIKALFSHYSLWVGSAVLILAIGIPFQLPVAAVSGFVFMAMFFINKIRFQRFWHKVVTLFSRKAKDLEDLNSFYGADGRVMLVSVIAGRIVGVIAIREGNYQEEGTEIPEDEVEDCCEVSRIYVHPRCRRLGIATRLMDEIEDRALDKGYQILKVKTYATSKDMLEFCFKNDFDRNYAEIFIEMYPLKFITITFEKDLDTNKNIHVGGYDTSSSAEG